MQTETSQKTGYPSQDRPWLKYYPPELIENLKAPECTLLEYLKERCPGEDVIAMHYYGTDITWKTLFEQVDLVAHSLKALGVKEGDQIPLFLRSVPEFIYLLLAAERVGASVLCRDNTTQENQDAVAKSGAHLMFAHDFFSLPKFRGYREKTSIRCVVLISPYQSATYNTVPEHIKQSIDSHYRDDSAYGPKTLGWERFLELGKSYTGEVDAPKDINRPLFCAYTSGSTGPSKQVIHCARTLLGNLHQVDFYATSGDFRPTWLVTRMPPALVAVVVSMLLLPLASNKLLILDPFVHADDVDLELMRYRPNCWPLIPMLIEIVMHSNRIPADYDMSHLFACGVGSEAFNNNQIKRTQKFLEAHNCKALCTSAYGCSEAGATMTLTMYPHTIRNGDVGVPVPLSILSVFKPGTHEELTYGECGELCITGPGLMLGYDNEKATARVLQTHADGRVWLHTGDIGYMTEDGVVYCLTRGSAPRFGFTNGQLATLPMENRLADAEIEGIEDEFFVIAPDTEHRHHFLPYLYVVLKEGYTVDDIRDAVNACLDDYMRPVEIFTLPKRRFWHFKTDRVHLIKEIMKTV